MYSFGLICTASPCSSRSVAPRRTRDADVLRFRTKLEHWPERSSYLEQKLEPSALLQPGLYLCLTSRVASSPFEFSAFFFVESHGVLKH